LRRWCYPGRFTIALTFARWSTGIPISVSAARKWKIAPGS
jgi:hypothetical protein